MQSLPELILLWPRTALAELQSASHPPLRRYGVPAAGIVPFVLMQDSLGSLQGIATVYLVAGAAVQGAEYILSGRKEY